MLTSTGLWKLRNSPTGQDPDWCQKARQMCDRAGDVALGVQCLWSLPGALGPASALHKLGVGVHAYTPNPRKVEVQRIRKFKVQGQP